MLVWPTSSPLAYRLYIAMMTSWNFVLLLFLARGKFSKYRTSMNQTFIIERIIIDFDCRTRCPVKGKRVFFAPIAWLTIGKTWLQAEQQCPILALITQHGHGSNAYNNPCLHSPTGTSCGCENSHSCHHLQAK